MANTQRHILPHAALAALVLALVLGWWWREPVRLYTTTAAAVGARTACACRHIAGRPLDDCPRDFEPGMSAVFLSEDEAARSVTARVPLLASQTATFRDGFGCVLEPWSE